MNKGLSEKLKRDIKLEIVEGGGGCNIKLKAREVGGGQLQKWGKKERRG